MGDIVGPDEHVDVWGVGNSPWGGIGGSGSGGLTGATGSGGFALGASLTQFQKDFAHETRSAWDKFVDGTKAFFGAVWDGLVWIYENILKKLGFGIGPGVITIGGVAFEYGKKKNKAVKQTGDTPIDLTMYGIIGAIVLIVYLLFFR